MNIFNSLLRWIGVYSIYDRYLTIQTTRYQLPDHVGIILDGNRRWASENEYPIYFGHNTGANIATHLLEWCHDLGIKTLTVYVLSTENLQRPQKELDGLFEAIREKLQELINDDRLRRYKVRVKGIGRLELLPQKIRNLLAELEESTSNFEGHFLNLALAYGGRTEIVDVVKKIVAKCESGDVKVDEITQETVETHLYTAHLSNPDPDLIIRTSGEERLSGFLLWQSAYSELIFLDVYWPDFRKIDLMRAIRTYQQRARRFGS